MLRLGAYRKAKLGLSGLGFVLLVGVGVWGVSYFTDWGFVMRVQDVAATSITVGDSAALHSALAEAAGPINIHINADLMEFPTAPFVVPAGAIVTLTGNQTITANGNHPVMIVNPGGKLVLDGPHLTRTVGSIGDASRGVLVNNGSLVMNSGSIHGHTTYLSAGVAVHGGTFIMNGGHIFNNTATGIVAASGGGVGVWSSSSAVMNRGVISGNTADNGGGLYVGFSSTFTMGGDAMIMGNTATNWGGGVYMNGLNGTSAVAFTMEGGTIIGNTAGSAGGGVAIRSGAVFTMIDGDIVNNHTTAVSINSGGGGVKVDSGIPAETQPDRRSSFVMYGGSIRKNSTSDHDVNSGGGVSVMGWSYFTMHDGIISGNKARRGGGVGNGGIFTMIGGSIRGNTATWFGGGVSTHRSFNMQGGVIEGNNSEGSGGGISLWAAGSNFEIQGGTVRNNIAALDGGGIHWMDLGMLAAINVSEGVFYGNFAGNGFATAKSGVADLTSEVPRFVEVLGVGGRTWTREPGAAPVRSFANGLNNFDITNPNNLQAAVLVTFDSRGGSAVSSQVLPLGDMAVAPVSPIREGYTFVEWRLGGSAWNFNNQVMENITLYAYWREGVPGVPNTGFGRVGGVGVVMSTGAVVAAGVVVVVLLAGGGAVRLKKVLVGRGR